MSNEVLSIIKLVLSSGPARSGDGTKSEKDYIIHRLIEADEKTRDDCINNMSIQEMDTIIHGLRLREDLLPEREAACKELQSRIGTVRAEKIKIIEDRRKDMIEKEARFNELSESLLNGSMKIFPGEIFGNDFVQFFARRMANNEAFDIKKLPQELVLKLLIYSGSYYDIINYVDQVELPEELAMTKEFKEIVTCRDCMVTICQKDSPLLYRKVYPDPNRTHLELAMLHDSCKIVDYLLAVGIRPDPGITVISSQRIKKSLIRHKCWITFWNPMPYIKFMNADFIDFIKNPTALKIIRKKGRNYSFPGDVEFIFFDLIELITES